MDKNKTQQIIIWVVALIVIFAVATIFGWKVFYGYVVPQANNIAVFSTLGLFAFAALAGIMVNFGPCSLAVLPAYMSFYLDLNTENQNLSVGKSARLGTIASLGVVGFYLVLGLAFATAGTFLATYAPQLKLAIAALILILGIMLLRGKSLEFDFISRFKDSVSKASAGRSHIASLLGFGVVYGTGGLSCFLPIFLPLVFFPFVGGQFFESIASFAIFALFQAFFLIGATILVGLGKQTIFHTMIGKAGAMKKIAGAILIATSIYMFGIFVFLGM
ncbi:MAG: hypothetical protein COU81_00950 [Candidatus Portnoybacteria bacterium CG10_big_fil_rev_8_21_14_0_10_36_7]|uniref:Uncharacterized protein n=1 Tax=Candidatus Portnoybacteria bacterium CG10_big_fil_rev_8_21_14_0_10_36_7 TaxID=1974812 RepID=A0A2M8KEP1_9BACT|nr:MAG: hypothetical protein COU81_00950 [Candidatus Portnoybacteria bacterium CG10_big_fil_rev_8_21_14_0_10_36_7]